MIRMDKFRKEIESIGKRLSKNQKKLLRIEAEIEKQISATPAKQSSKPKSSRRNV
jgi:hypothetical protein